jgi:hypothetical protein
MVWRLLKNGPQSNYNLSWVLYLTGFQNEELFIAGL